MNQRHGPVKQRVYVMNEAIKFSIVVPLYNEEASVTPLYVRLTQVMTGLDDPTKLYSSTTAARIRHSRLFTKFMRVTRG